MDKTSFSKKCEILNDFYMEYSGSDEYDEFISINDLGFPAAVLVMNGSANLTDIGINFVNDTWKAMCEVLEVDHMGEYNSLTEMENMSDE